jgi:hypothetical protein
MQYDDNRHGKGSGQIGRYSLQSADAAERSANHH